MKHDLTKIEGWVEAYPNYFSEGWQEKHLDDKYRTDGIFLYVLQSCTSNPKWKRLIPSTARPGELEECNCRAPKKVSDSQDDVSLFTTPNPPCQNEYLHELWARGKFSLVREWLETGEEKLVGRLWL